MTPDDWTSLIGRRVPLVHLLSNGRYRTSVSAAGGGLSSCGDIALTRWQPDLTRDANGLFLYIAEPAERRWWSAGFEPSRVIPDQYSVAFEPGLARLAREDSGIATTLEIVVETDRDAECRRLTLVNRSPRPRVLEITSYGEVALNHPAADAAHPAFSKLFVSTERIGGRPVLLARRRPRGADEKPIWLAHALTRSGTADPGSVETDRMRFLSRGGSAGDPAAMKGTLSGTVGNVLDPVVAIRHQVTLEPGESAVFVAQLSFGPTREIALGPIDAPLPWESLLAAATTRDRELRDRTGIDAGLAALLPRLTGAMLYGHAASARPARPPRRLAEVRHAAEWWRAQGVLLGSNDVDRERRLRALASMPAEDEESEQPVATRQSLPRPPARRTRAVEPLAQWNGIGGFSADGLEYRIEIAADGRRPPLPWTNVMANERFGTVVSESGAACTWSGNSREYRLTPWSNDPVSDPSGEALYLRDLDSGAVWCPTPGPVPAAVPCQVAHGLGYTRWSSQADDLEHDLVQFVARDQAVKLSRLRLTNVGSKPRRVALFSFTHWVLGSSADISSPFVAPTIGPTNDMVLATTSASSDWSGRVAVAALLSSSTTDPSATTDRTSFLGPVGDPREPVALWSNELLHEETGEGLDPCAAIRIELEILPRQTVECCALLGDAESEEDAVALVDQFRDASAVESALEEVRQFWRDAVSRIQIETPVPALDLMVNGWLVYQNLSCRMWGRTAFYQSGGAFGFRDQLQDSLALLMIDPSIARRQILLHSAHQFLEGDVLHWWHPPASKGIRTRFADDLLWLPLLTAQYIKQTGDPNILDEMVPFMRAPALKPGEDEVFLLPERDTTSATVYEHCCRAIDRSLEVGAHGLPLFGTGDWNDGMNRVGREGKGESVWMGFFLARTLELFAPLAARRGDRRRTERYQDHRRALVQALNDGGWDGQWYRRGYFDDGAPLGSAQNDECRIDAIAQAWAVLSGAAPADRAGSALTALESHLVSEADGIIRLLTPPFNRTEHDPGYIKGYLPGVRENGGQYTHGALWAVQALAEAGHSDRAAALLAMISPVTHGRDAAAVARYQVEPYVIAADIYGVAPHVGRGGWTWYTGSAGWMFRVAIESILGVTLEGGTVLVVRPAMPKSWPSCTFTYRPAGGRSRYRLTIRRDSVKSDGGIRVTVDGAPVDPVNGVARIELAADDLEHRVEIAFDRELGLSYRPRP